MVAGKGVKFETNPTSKKGKDKSPAGVLKATAKEAKKSKCIADARSDTEKWEECIEDNSGAVRWLIEAAGSVGFGEGLTADDVCQLEALTACGLNKKKGTAKGKKVSKYDEEQTRLAKQTEQGFLLQNLSQISQDIELETFTAAQGTEGARFPNLILINGIQGNLVNVMSTSRQLSPLLHASPLELSSLMPSVKIFKRYNTTGADPERNKSWQAGDLDEFRFADTIRVEDITEDRSAYGSGVGLKSFEWKTTGTDAYTAPRTLMATLKLHFQTLSDLVDSTAGAGGPKWTDLMLPRPGNMNLDNNCSVEEEADLGVPVNDAEEDVEQSRHAKRRESIREFALVVEAGYKYPSSNVFEGASGDAFKRAIDKSKVVLALTLRSHQFSFNENGTIDLTVEYSARYEGLANTYATDIFNLNANGENVIAQNLMDVELQVATIQKDISSPTGLTCALKEAASDKDKNAVQKLIDEKKEKIEKLKESIDKQKKTLKVSNYGNFVQWLVKEGKLYSIEADESDWENGVVPKGAVVSSVGNDLENASMSVYKSLLDSETGDISSAGFAQLMERKVFGKTPTPRGKVEINYFFLGDLINYISYALPDNAPSTYLQDAAEKYEIVLGDIEFLDWRVFKQEALQIKATMEATNRDTANEGERSRLVQLARSNKNLAFLPISFDFYSMWFSKNVINGNSVWTFRDYLNKLLSELVMGSLHARTNDEVGTAMRRLFNERNRVRRGILIGQNPLLQRGKLIHDPTTIAANGENQIWIEPSTASQGETLTQYLVICATKMPHSSTAVDEAANKQEGIYHLKIGTDGGIVKSIDFQRTAKSEIRDWNIMRAYNTGDTSIGAILEPYNATVRLFGCGFWQPGQYVYLNPATLGFGSELARLSLARKLGLGGFYLINTVETVIEAGKLETVLDCRFEYYGTLPDEAGSTTTTSGGTPTGEEGAQTDIGDPSATV